MGIGVLVGLGADTNRNQCRTPYKMLMDHPSKRAITPTVGTSTVINPWLNFSTMITGKNLVELRFWETRPSRVSRRCGWRLGLNKWFIWEDESRFHRGGQPRGSGGAGIGISSAVPETELTRVRSLLTIVGGSRPQRRGAVEARHNLRSPSLCRPRKLMCFWGTESLGFGTMVLRKLTDR
jgi:hypothetical protein